jgi:hypothetical protein
MESVPPVGPYALKLPAETQRTIFEFTGEHDDIRGDCNKCIDNESKEHRHTVLNGSPMELNDSKT